MDERREEEEEKSNVMFCLDLELGTPHGSCKSKP